MIETAQEPDSTAHDGPNHPAEDQPGTMVEVTTLVTGATGLLETAAAVDSQSSQVGAALVTGSTYLVLVTVDFIVMVVVGSTQSTQVGSDEEAAGSTCLLVVLVDSSQSAHVGSAAAEVVAGSTGFLVVVVLDDSQSAHGSVEVVAGSTFFVVVVVVVVLDELQSSQVFSSEVVVTAAAGVVDVEGADHFLVVEVVVEVVAPSTGLVPHPVVVLVLSPSTGSTLVEFQSSQVSRATLLCSLACMFSTWLAAETDPITAAPAAAIVTALMLMVLFPISLLYYW